MRLTRLDLTRYGKFTDHVVDFGPRPAGGPDLHLVYGPNEAGKSTLFNGWLDLLFGIPLQSGYNFLHPYPNMQIGAAIEFGGQTREFIRRKRSQASLFDDRDQPVPDSALLAGLGGLDRDSYRTMFSLDDETLEKGGEDILASHGDLGELLFSASAGLSEFSDRLARIRAEAEEFYKYRARSGRLAELKSELAALKAERDRLDTQASEYARLTKAHDEARTRHAQASAERQLVRTRLDIVSSLLAALPRLGELESLLRQIEPLADLPDVAPDWREQIRGLGNEDAALSASAAALAEDIKRLSEERDAIGVDDQILALRTRMADLDRLRTRHDTAGEDLPERRLALGRIEGRIEQVLARLGRTGDTQADRLLLDTARTAALRELIETRVSLDAQLMAAKKEIVEAKSAGDETRAQLLEAGGDPAETAPSKRQGLLAALSDTLTSLREQDHGLRRQAARRAIVPAREKYETRLRQLAPWQGDIAELHTMVPPSADALRGWKTEAEETARKLANCNDEIARLSQSLKRLEAEAEAVARTRALPSIEEAEALRTARDEAWARHKSKLDPDSAKTFEAAMAAYDTAADKRGNHQSEVAKLNETLVQIAILRADLDGAAASKAKLEATHTSLHGQIAAAVTAMSPGLPADMAPDALSHWLDRRELAIEVDAELRAHLHDLETAENDRKAATERLARALKPLDAMASADEEFETLFARAQDLLSRETGLEAQRQLLAAQDRMLQKREQDLRAAEDELKAWMLAWKNACAGSWLGERDRVPTAAEVREMLPLIAELGVAINDRSSLADRIAKMERDQAAYAEALEAIAHEAGIETRDVAVAGIARRLADRLAAAQTAKSRHDSVAGQIEAARARQRAHAEKQAAHAQNKAGMLAALQAETLADAALRVDRALERTSLSRQAGQIREQIRQGLGLETFEDAKAQLAAVEPESLKREKLELEARLETLDSDVQELFAARQSAADALNAVGGDDAVARIEQQRQTTLLALSDGAERYLRLSAGILAMEQALSLYRERHRSSMMARASDAVRTISRGRYTGLASQTDHGRDKGRELLIALQNDGASKQAAEMSKGARFQLYLALRVAGFHEFAETRPTVPFIADDIMETFDDFRAEETFRLFSGMAEVGQVIYLTHHRHLCDIAKTVCPGVSIHQLEA